MRFARLATSDGPRYARLDGDLATMLDAAPWLGARSASPTVSSWGPEQLLCPVEPSKIICVGRNYAAHAKELGNDVPAEPLLFFKPPSSLIGPRGTIVLPIQSDRVEHEAELTVVIGTRARNVAVSDAMKHVFGFTAANDVTARDLQRKDGQWTRAKGFDTFCPVGPWIETDVRPGCVRVLCRVNGAERQDGRTSQMVFDVPALIAYVSSVMTLEPGDVILTGTPEGVGPLRAGDVCEIELRDDETSGELFLFRNDVRSAPST